MYFGWDRCVWCISTHPTPPCSPSCTQIWLAQLGPALIGARVDVGIGERSDGGIGARVDGGIDNRVDERIDGSANGGMRQ